VRGAAAEALGKQDDYKYCTKLAHNYRNVFNPKIGFMSPKSEDGQRVAHFDAKLGSGQGGMDYFTEMRKVV
jgi:putative alpha-1,2-mannosidase